VLNQLQADAKPYSCIVVCHARELAFQIKNEFKRLGKYTNFKVKAVYGGVEESVDIHMLKNKKP
jgi:ATP-dependent RNA helicase UAP56/SUB2